MHKTFTILSKAKSCVSMCISFYDLAELFRHVWSATELIIVITVAAWIPILKFSVFLFNNFGIQIPFGIPERHSKIILWTLYWITVVASIFNYISKYLQDSDPSKMIAWGILYLFILIADYVETKETIHKIEDLG